jgi:hypothetical protein
MDDFNRLHGSVEAFGDGFIQLARRMSKFAGKVAQEGSEKEHLYVIIT